MALNGHPPKYYGPGNNTPPMPEPTPNRGYNRPDEGAADWHVPLNENFTAIDEDVQLALGGGLVHDAPPSEAASVPLPPGDSTPVFNSFQVPADGRYRVLATVNVDAADMDVATAYGPGTLLVNGNREHVFDGVIVNPEGGAGFNSIVIGPLEVPHGDPGAVLLQGDTITPVVSQHSNVEIQTGPAEHNSAFQVWQV